MKTIVTETAQVIAVKIIRESDYIQLAKEKRIGNSRFTVRMKQYHCQSQM